MRKVLLAVALAGAAGCAIGRDDETGCGRTTAPFTPTYAELSGTCGEYTGIHVGFGDGSLAGIRVFDDRRVTQEGIIHGCTARLVQVADRDGHIIERLEGEQLRFHADGSLHGMVTLERFDEQGEVTCSSEYSAVLTRVDAGT